MDMNVILGFISIVVTLLCAYLGALLHRKTERIKIMEGQLSEKRYSAYEKLYDFFYDMFKNAKDNKPVNNREMRNRLLEAKKELIMYGTDEVVFALNSYLSSLTEENIYKQVDSFCKQCSTSVEGHSNDAKQVGLQNSRQDIIRRCDRAKQPLRT